MKPKTIVTLILIIQPYLHVVAQTISETFTDTRDGKTYRTVRIGKLTWMAENLNFLMDNSVCYDNDAINCQTYGRLYTWNDAMNACPAGWHLPDTSAWSDLVKITGGIYAASNTLKSKVGWQNSSNGTDEFGFSALPGGGRSDGGRFRHIGEHGNWWSASPDPSPGDNGAYSRNIFYDNDYVYESPNYKSIGFSVRCVRE